MNIFELIVVQPIFNLLVLLYSLIGDFGVSIIIFTVIVRLLMWPLIKRQLHQVKVMRKLQPELKRIKAKAKGNRQLEGMQMLELYKKHGVSPFRSIGILLLQLPIFIALYQVIQIITLHRDQVAKYTYDGLEGIGRIAEIIKNPDTFNETLLGLVDLTKHAISPEGINIFLVVIAIGAAVLQYVMSKQTLPADGEGKRLRDVMNEAASGKQPDQAEMNAIVMRKMIKFLPFMMFVIMINLPGALALFYAVSNIVAVLQQRYILQKDESELEAIADQPVEKKPPASKKPSTKKPAASRAKTAKEATITRISAKDSGGRKTK